MYNTQYQYTHDIDWFFLLRDRPIHCASNGGRIPSIYRAIDLQNLQVEVEAIAPINHFVLNRASIELYVRERYQGIDEDLLRRTGLPELVNNIAFDKNIPVWMKVYSWSFAKMAQRGFFSFDRDAKTGLYFLVASPMDFTEFHGNISELMYKLPENGFTLDPIQVVKKDFLEQINFVSVIERYERKKVSNSRIHYSR